MTVKFLEKNSQAIFCEIFSRVCEINNLSNQICRLREFFFEYM